MIQGLLRRAATFLAIAAATWLLLALVLYLLLPRTISQIYSGRVRDIVQYSCGRFHTDVLIYTLRPGECRFANPEFDTRVTVDADGFRNAPEHRGSGPIKIAVTGDSHAMGWGVEQDEKIASVIARDRRFTVRDLAMSSYGTPRELVAVLRHARDADVIVIQYCDNDRTENATFVRDPAGYFASAEVRAKAYAFDVGNEMAKADSTPRLRRGLRIAMAALAKTWDLLHLPPRHLNNTPSHVLSDEAAQFAGVLAHFKTELAGKTIVVYDGHARAPRPGFAATFQSALAAQGMGRVIVLDLVGKIGSRDFYQIDEHMRPSGHAKVAASIIETLDKSGHLNAR